MCRLFRSLIVMGLIACAAPASDERSAGFAAPSATQQAAAGPVLREEAAVRVGNSLEHWALLWRQPPIAACGPEEAITAITSCPCSGFAYGEMGELDLVRRRPGHSEERLPMTPLFDGGENPGWEKHLAVLQRWPMSDVDYQAADSIDLGPIVRARPVTRVITPEDYDRDGHATEFLLQVETLPCGKKQAVLIGVSAADSSLHVFTSVAHPERPLELPTYIWDRLRRSHGSTVGVEWACGDHGSDTETDVRLWVSPQGFDGVRSEYRCAAGGARGRLISSERI